MILNHALT